MNQRPPTFRSAGLLSGFATIFLSLIILCGLAQAHAATNEPGPDDIPKLIPPRPEIGPTFLETHGLVVGVGAAVGVIVLATAIWVFTRPRARAGIPPEVEVRRELEPLRQRPEDGTVLSRVSQAVRHYVARAFHLPAGELTTAEFCRAMTAQAEVGPELSSDLAEFLRVCDERKFAPSPPPTPLGAVPKALELIELAEARRAWLRQQTAANANGPATASASGSKSNS
jgi:hypothetical protein